VDSTDATGLTDSRSDSEFPKRVSWGHSRKATDMESREYKYCTIQYISTGQINIRQGTFDFDGWFECLGQRRPAGLAILSILLRGGRRTEYFCTSTYKKWLPLPRHSTVRCS